MLTFDESLEILKAFNPKQPRDARGRWTSGGGASTSTEVKPAKPQYVTPPGHMTDEQLRYETRNGSGAFKEYHDAYRAAQLMARSSGKDIGLERSPYAYNYKPGYSVRALPKPQNRYGHELRVQVVTPFE